MDLSLSITCNKLETLNPCRNLQVHGCKNESFSRESLCTIALMNKSRMECNCVPHGFFHSYFLIINMESNTRLQIYLDYSEYSRSFSVPSLSFRPCSLFHAKLFLRFPGLFATIDVRLSHATWNYCHISDSIRLFNFLTRLMTFLLCFIVLLIKWADLAEKKNLPLRIFHTGTAKWLEQDHHMLPIMIYTFSG